MPFITGCMALARRGHYVAVRTMDRRWWGKAGADAGLLIRARGAMIFTGSSRLVHIACTPPPSCRGVTAYRHRVRCDVGLCCRSCAAPRQVGGQSAGTPDKPSA